MPVKAKLSQAVAKVMSDPGCASASPSSTSRRTSSPARRMHAKLESEIKNWTRFIDAKGIKAE